MATAATQSIELFRHALRLKRLPRTGWLIAGVSRPESIADHSFGTVLVAYVLSELVNSHSSAGSQASMLDTGKVAKIALIHDLAECVVTDLPLEAADLIGRDTKHAAEYTALQNILRDVPGEGRLLELWCEYKDGVTAEARVVQDADKIEMVIQARAYASYGNANLEEFWTGHSWHFEESRTLFEMIISQESS